MVGVDPGVPPAAVVEEKVPDERAGERGPRTRLLAGEAEREPGGVRVERKREAAAAVVVVDGVERRLWRGRVISDWARGWWCWWASGCVDEGEDGEDGEEEDDGGGRDW